MRILKGSCKELGASIRLITCRESTREHDDLCVIDVLFESFNGRSDILRGLVLEHPCHYIRAGSRKRLCAVIFTVGARKYRYKDGGSCHLMLTNINLVCLIDFRFHRLHVLLRLGGEYLLKGCFPCAQRLFHSDCHILIGKAAFIRNKRNLSKV